MQEFTGMLTYLPERTPNLEQLDLGVKTTSNMSISCEWHEVLPRLCQLKTLRISIFLFDANPHALYALSQLPKLESLCTYCLDDGRWKELPSDHVARDPMPSSNGGFRSLKSLKLLSPFKYASSMIEGYGLADLRFCKILSRTQENDHDFVRIFEAVAANPPKLRTSVLNSIRSDPQPQGSTIGLLQPITHCYSLTELYLQAAFPLNLNTESVTTFLKALPALQTLVLYEVPAVAGPPTLSLAALAAFVPLCPHMTTISLYADTQDHTPIIGGNKPFPALRYLDIGLSPLNSPTAEVAAFLSGILPEGCKLDWHGEDYNCHELLKLGISREPPSYINQNP
ncbi:hypothetical protein EYR40_009657 [Pleurotus pulmonarius]|nr:hypothetical protein EYR38_009251 [Pleurotus pulmonarius]KAF4591057.1 hypothetical protein EYR40_009657 [Pleurotus pulmonarius]